MQTILIASIVIRLAGLGWSLLLVRRLRDWRMGVLAGMFALMAARQTLTLLGGGPMAAADPAAAAVSELPGLLVSLLAFLSVWWIEDVITDRAKAAVRVREYAEELRRNQELGSLGVLAGGVAHEFNNTLMSISGFTELALSRLGRHEAARGYLERVLDAVRRGERLAGGISSFAKRAKETRAVVDVAAEALAVSKLLRVTLPAGLQLRRRLPAAKVPVAATATEIQHLLVTLCALARARWSGVAGAAVEMFVERLPAAVDPGGDEPLFDVVRVGVAIVEASPDAARLRSRPFPMDGGIGVPPEELLPAVREVVTKLGGWVETSGEELRCEVSIFLPAAMEGPAVEAGAAAAPEGATAGDHPVGVEFAAGQAAAAFNMRSYAARTPGGANHLEEEP